MLQQQCEMNIAENRKNTEKCVNKGDLINNIKFVLIDIKKQYHAFIMAI